ncbi:uncharacterized protein LOC113215287 [Frankliniella occidentalis]|uniref:Uncharacterized protein LOC113215287 n=1 Tax=Frankliniella occidentalis TaxID=133901 RepID=A0A9C6XS65_FRAOC|nr:uncharacterized protein LOC113215287 [Frankliniella occidentalis]
MDRNVGTCCVIRLFSAGSQITDLTKGQLCKCQLPNFHIEAGALLSLPGNEETKCHQVPVVHLDSVDEWSENRERFYVFGLSAWLRVKPFVSLFTSDFSVKLGTCSPYVVRSPLIRKTLIWHTVQGFPHEKEGAYFKDSNKVWLKLPIKSAATFQTFVLEILGLHMFKTMCYPCSGPVDFVFCHRKGKQPSQILIYGVESEMTVASFFAGLSAYEDSECQQYVTVCTESSYSSGVENGAAYLLHKNHDGSKCPQALSVMQVNAAECEVEEMSFHQIKSEIKVEPEWQPHLKQRAEDTVKERVGRKSQPTVKCPGCLAVYSGNLALWAIILLIVTESAQCSIEAGCELSLVPILHKLKNQTKDSLSIFLCKGENICPDFCLFRTSLNNYCLVH